MLSLMNTFNPVYYNQNIEYNLKVLEPLLHKKLSPIPVPLMTSEISEMINVRVRSKIIDFKNMLLQARSTSGTQIDSALDKSCPICFDDIDTDIFICMECGIITHTECIINACVNKASCPYCRSEKFKTGLYFKDIKNQEIKDAIPITREIWFRYPSFKLPSKEENLSDARKRFLERNLLLTCKVMGTGYFYSEFSIIGDEFHARARTNDQRVSQMMRDFTSSLHQDRVRNLDGERMGWSDYETYFRNRYSVDREPTNNDSHRTIRPSRTQIVERFYSFDHSGLARTTLNDPPVSRR